MQMPPLPAELTDTKHARRILLLVALLAACALRFWLLDSKSYWLDEAWTTQMVARGQAAFWDGQTEQYHPPLFYALLELWTRVGGDAFFWRAPSALFGVLTVAFVYAFTQATVGRAAAVTTVWLAAFSPWLIWYAQELRMYSLFACLFLLGVVAIVRYLTSPHAGWWLTAVAAVTLALYTHYAALLLLPLFALLGVLYLALGKANPTTALLALLAWPTALLFYWPWLLSPAAQRLAQVAGSHPHWGRYISLLLDYPLLLALLVICGVIAMSAGLYLLYRLAPRMWAWLGARRTRPWLQGVALALYCGILILSVFPRGYTFKRQLLIFWPLVLPFFGWVWPWEWANRRVVGVLLGLSLVAAVATVTAVPKDQWREATAYILEHRQPGDLVLLLPAHMRMPFGVYAGDDIKFIGQLPAQLHPRLPDLARDYARIWLVAYPRDMTAEDHAIQAWLEQASMVRDTKHFFRIDVTLFDTQQ